MRKYESGRSSRGMHESLHFHAQSIILINVFWILDIYMVVDSGGQQWFKTYGWPYVCVIWNLQSYNAH